MSPLETVGKVVDGKYKIEKQLGKGGMGTVYLATHIGTGRPVAIKVIVPQFMQRREFVERFRREAKAAGRLRHPNVVDVTDFGFSVDEDGAKTAYLVMEYLDGCTLGEILEEEKTIPLEFTVEILEQVCSAVDEAHRQGIIHRDPKPDNIWLEPNQRGGYTVKVLDFGIAKLEETQLESSHVPELVRDYSKTRLVGEKETLADENDAATVVDADNATYPGEAGTRAVAADGATRVAEDSSEAGTMIQQVPVDESPGDRSEAGTIVQGSPDERSVRGGEAQTAEYSSAAASRVAEKDGEKTNIISDAVGTDEEVKPILNTSDLTKAGAVLGTPLYMSPEQCRGETLTPASDIYSLSVIVYQMLSGHLPFMGDYVEVMNGHKNEPPPNFKARKVPEKLKSVVMSSLSKDPRDRPESAEALASKLRANSEGLGVLLRRSVVIYSERLPKFLMLALITFAPLVVVTFLRVGISFLSVFEIIESRTLEQLNTVGLGLTGFFLQIVSAAILVGTTTWVVGQVLAFPLRPISIGAAFKEVGKRWKPLTGTVTLSTILALLGWFAGAVAGLLGFVFFIAAAGGIFGKVGAIISSVSGAAVGMIVLGTLLTGLFMLIAPSIMMEGVSGKAAFKRSIELTLRSLRTVLATSLLVYFVPAVLALAIGLSVGSVIRNFEMSREMSKMKKEGVVAQKPGSKEDDVNFTITTTGGITESRKSDADEKEEKDMTQQFSKALQEGIFELLWTPLAILISSFTSVITALIYFKTRQAGGESMQGLLSKLDNADRPQTNWQHRVRQRLIQSGRVMDSQSDPQA